MSANILLTGRPGIGKTTLIQRVLAHVDTEVGGFFTREVAPGGVRRGFEMITLDGESGFLAHETIDGPPRVGKYGVDVAALDAIGVASIRRALDRGALTVIDEIGPMECYSPAFKAIVLEALDSTCIVLGTIVQRSTAFGDHVKARPDVAVIEVRADNRATLAADILARLHAAGVALRPAAGDSR